MATTEWGRISFENPNGTITTVIIQAVKYSDGQSEGVTFTLQVEGDDSSISAGDIQGFFIDFAGNKEPVARSLSGLGVLKLIQGDDTILWAGTKANNMNGMAANAAEGAIANDGYDVGVELTTPGASGGNVNFVTFSIKGINLNALDGQRFGIRLQNTLNEEGSLKLEGTFDQPDPNECVFGGYRWGSWLKGSRSEGRDKLLNDNSLTNETFETLIFGGTRDDIAYGIGDDPKLAEALDLNGGGNSQLAAQATAAYLNALYLDQDDDPVTCYQFTIDQIKEFTSEALSGNPVNLKGYSWYVDDNDIKGFDAGDTQVFGNSNMNAEDLKNLFDFNNNLSELTTALPNPMLTDPMVSV